MNTPNLTSATLIGGRFSFADYLNARAYWRGPDCDWLSLSELYQSYKDKAHDPHYSYCQYRDHGFAYWLICYTAEIVHCQINDC